ncbi:MAG: hypothetical protein HZC17_09075 [Candidatus Omnitrophica bacterium]|nr:hypothetical protein [Candidatus Omnitrophota bacterium]
MPRTAKSKKALLEQLIEEQADEQSQRSVYPQVITLRGGSIFDSLTDNQTAAIVLGRVLGPKRASDVLGVSVSGIEKHILRGEVKLSVDQRVRLKKSLKIISAIN